MRFKAVGSPRAVRRVRLDESDGPGAEWTVESCGESGEFGLAHGVTVEDSSAGSSMLIYGGVRGLRLRSAADGSVVAEPYLLLAERAVVE